MFQEKLPHKFPWRIGNHINFYIDGKQFFPAMLKAINSAKKNVLMEMYLFESGIEADKFITAFIDAAKRGVTVQLLVDGYGGKGLSKNNREQLTKSGVQLVFFNPLSLKKLKKNLRRTHRKYLIIDATSVFVGGEGLTDDFVGQSAWRETVAEIQGSVVADWYELFKNNFQEWSNTIVPEMPDLQNYNNNEQARLTYTKGGNKLEIKRVLLNRINNCQESIWFSSAYFIPSRKIRKALIRAAVKGKDVRLLLPGPKIDHPSVRYASRAYYTKLLRSGVRVFEYQERFIHAKTIIIDDWFTIGSANIDRWNFRWNLEANIEVKEAESIQQLRQIMIEDFSNSEEIHYKLWINRSRIQRIREWIWRKVDIFLTKFV